MNKKESILRPIEKVMFTILLTILFLTYYFVSEYSFLNSVLLSVCFTLMCLAFRIIALKLSEKFSKNEK